MATRRSRLDQRPDHSEGSSGHLSSNISQQDPFESPRSSHFGALPYTATASYENSSVTTPNSVSISAPRSRSQPAQLEQSTYQGPGFVQHYAQLPQTPYGQLEPGHHEGAQMNSIYPRPSTDHFPPHTNENIYESLPLYSSNAQNNRTMQDTSRERLSGLRQYPLVNHSQMSNSAHYNAPATQYYERETTTATSNTLPPIQVPFPDYASAQSHHYTTTSQSAPTPSYAEVASRSSTHAYIPPQSHPSSYPTYQPLTAGTAPPLYHRDHSHSIPPSHLPLPRASRPSLRSYNSARSAQANSSRSPKDERPYHYCQEPGCNARPFSTYGNLRRHTREQHGEAKSHICERCNLRFTRSTARDNHVRENRCPRQGGRRGYG